MLEARFYSVGFTIDAWYGGWLGERGSGLTFDDQRRVEELPGLSEGGIILRLVITRMDCRQR